MEEIFRVTARLWLNVLVVSNGSLPIWPDLKKLRPAPGNTERRDETPFQSSGGGRSRDLVHAAAILNQLAAVIGCTLPAGATVVSRSAPRARASAWSPIWRE